MLIPKEGVDSSSGMLLSWMYIVFSRDSALVLHEYSTLSTVDFNFFLILPRVVQWNLKTDWQLFSLYETLYSCPKTENQERLSGMMDSGSWCSRLLVDDRSVTANSPERKHFHPSMFMENSSLTQVDSFTCTLNRNRKLYIVCSNEVFSIIDLLWNELR